MPRDKLLSHILAFADTTTVIVEIYTSTFEDARLDKQRGNPS
jgi:hypothetical protein